MGRKGEAGFGRMEKRRRCKSQQILKEQRKKWRSEMQCKLLGECLRNTYGEKGVGRGVQFRVERYESKEGRRTFS